MKYFSLILFMFLFTLIIAGPNADNDGCIQCHEIVDEDLDVELQVFPGIYEDIHLKQGFGCADCHGGDPTAFDDADAAMTDSESFLGNISRDMQPDVCGRCHSDATIMRMYSANVKTDQVSQYWTSQHGIQQKLGNRKTAVCTDCHGLHGIRAVSDPMSKAYPLNIPMTCAGCHADPEVMDGSGLPVDQMDKYTQSVHGTALLDQRDMGAPACNDCHGNHGAIPPNISHISDICGTCHLNNKTLFQESHVGEIFIAEGIGQCAGCHNYHDVLKPNDEFLNWNTESVCIDCHEDGQDARRLSDELYDIVITLRDRGEMAAKLVESAEQKGMDVSELLYHLEDVHTALVQTRTSIHSFNPEFVTETASAGMKAAELAVAGAKESVKEYYFRRKGLFISSLIISLLALALYMKIRSLEKNQ